MEILKLPVSWVVLLFCGRGDKSKMYGPFKLVFGTFIWFSIMSFPLILKKAKRVIRSMSHEYPLSHTPHTDSAVTSALLNYVPYLAFLFHDEISTNWPSKLIYSSIAHWGKQANNWFQTSQSFFRFFSIFLLLFKKHKHCPMTEFWCRSHLCNNCVSH